MKIPFYKTEQSEDASILLAELISDENQNLSGPGAYSNLVEKLIREKCLAEKSLTTSSGTAALEMIAILLHIKAGDEIIMPSWTFSSTANAFILRGAKIVFVDVEIDTLNIDPIKALAAISEKTKAIIAINYGGIPAQLKYLKSICDSAGIAFIEDNAHGLGGQYENRPLGSFGVLSAQSFHSTKNLQCGEGGAIVINDFQYQEQAEMVREKGTDRSAFFRGEIDKYTWRSVGSSFAMSELQAAFLFSNLNSFSKTQEKRKLLTKIYEEELKLLTEKNGWRIPTVPLNSVPAYHNFWLLLKSSLEAKVFIDFMKENGIGISRHYVPLHNSPASFRYGCTQSGSLENTDLIGSNLVRLPLYSRLKIEEIRLITSKIKEFANG